MTLRELLNNGAEEIGVSLAEADIDRFFLYVGELKKWNKKINLTTIIDDNDIIIKHILDSLSYAKGFIPRDGMRLLDMGSGAGFPALPLKIAFPELEVVLVESVKKKASFLRHIVRTLALRKAEIVDVRTDELPGSFRSSFNVVTARAFADMRTALTAGVPFLTIGGAMVLSRGPEETIAEPDLVAAGVVVENKIALTLPHSDYKRAIWVFKRTA